MLLALGALVWLDSVPRRIRLPGTRRICCSDPIPRQRSAAGPAIVERLHGPRNTQTYLHGRPAQRKQPHSHHQHRPAGRVLSPSPEPATRPEPPHQPDLTSPARPSIPPPAPLIPQHHSPAGLTPHTHPARPSPLPPPATPMLHRCRPGDTNAPPLPPRPGPDNPPPLRHPHSAASRSPAPTPPPHAQRAQQH
jgi:hypothetical protein